MSSASREISNSKFASTFLLSFHSFSRSFSMVRKQQLQALKDERNQQHSRNLQKLRDEANGRKESRKTNGRRRERPEESETAEKTSPSDHPGSL